MVCGAINLNSFSTSGFVGKMATGHLVCKQWDIIGKFANKFKSSKFLNLKKD